MRFTDFHLLPALEQAVSEQGYEKPTPIQARAIVPGLEGRDVLGIAQTGTGKTAAFALPILDRLGREQPQPSGRRHPRVLVLAPTRELAAQIVESFRDYGRHLHLKSCVVFGGVGQKPQEDEIRRGIDILVACPGRLLDLMNQGIVDLGSVEHLVLDEADRMLDMGFLPDIRRIVAKVPRERQTMFFSATMPEEINRLASDMLRDPVTVQVTPVATAADTVEQYGIHVAREAKGSQLEPLLKDANGRVLIFTRTKHGADRVVRKLTRGAGIEAAAIHGDKSQGARTKALEGFRAGTTPVLVASDIAARGLDIDEILLVVNYDIPADPDTYVHRIGRTGRAGASGRAITFVTSEDHEALRDIEKRIQRRIPVLGDAPAPAASRPEEEESRGRKAQPRTPKASKPSSPPRQGSSEGSGGGRSRRNDRGRGGRGGRSEEKSGSGRGEKRQDPSAPKSGARKSSNSRSENRRNGRSSDRARDDRRDDRNDAHKGDRRPLSEQRTASGKPLPKLSQPADNAITRLWKKFTGG
jgi:ATP-dependent RNA helicase RhlE